jgi:hypothetical protein
MIFSARRITHPSIEYFMTFKRTGIYKACVALTFVYLYGQIDVIDSRDVFVGFSVKFETGTNDGYWPPSITNHVYPDFLCGARRANEHAEICFDANSRSVPLELQDFPKKNER